MNNEDWKQNINKFKIVQKCPRCRELSLMHENGKIRCSNCGFEQNIGEIQ